MRVLFKTSVAAALSLTLGAGALCSHAAPVSVAGGNTTSSGDWRVSPNLGNASGQDWSGFAFSLTRSASIDSLSSAFMSPLSPGVENNIDSRNTQAIVKYSGTQLHGAVSKWGGTTNSDDLITAADPFDDTTDNLTFAMNQTPLVSEVRAPLAAWQSLTGLIFVIFITLIRPPKPVLIA